MSLLPFLVVAFGSAAASLLTRGRPTIAVAIGLTGLVAALACALLIRPNEILELGGGSLATTSYLRLFLVLGSGVGLILALVGLAAGTRRDGPAVILGTLALAALGLAIPDARIAVIAMTAGGLLGVLVTLGPVGARSGATIGVHEIRAVVVAGALAIAATAWIARPLGELAAQPVVFGLAFLAFGLAVAIRFGAIPFHVWAARLADAAPEAMLPILTAWGPAAFAVVALAWIDGSVAPLLLDMSTERTIIIAIALASIVLGAFAAWIQDDVEHVLGYSIVSDAGVVILALAALDPEVWAPARTWILAFVVARSAFAAWAAAVRAGFWTGRIDDLRGWAIRSPTLGVALLLVIAAGVGVPGLAAFEARAAIVQLALEGPLATIILIATLAPLAYYVRLLVIGVSRPDRQPEREPLWRPRIRPVDLTALRTWAIEMGTLNRAPAAASLALVLGVLALATSAGAFGGPEAAAALPPGFDGPGAEPGPIGQLGGRP